MPFYEIIFETGSKSVIWGDSDEEALEGIKAHHERATKGEPGRGKSTARGDLDPGAPQVMDYPAERVKRVLVYDKHPGDLNEDMTMSSEVVRKELDNIMKDQAGVVNLMELAAEVRALADPHVNDPGVHESQYKAKEVRELELDFA